MVKIENLKVDLDQTFHCGQNFRWKRQPDGSYLGNPAGHSVRAVRQGEELLLYGAKAEDEPFWRRYFDADSDYAALLAPVMDAHLQEALIRCPGIRLLDQPFFETLICFILSANNNIARITGIVERFCTIAAGAFRRTGFCRLDRRGLSRALSLGGGAAHGRRI